jgi:hypothetical protein
MYLIKLKKDLVALSKCIDSIVNQLDDAPKSFVIVCRQGVNMPNRPIIKTAYVVEYSAFCGVSESADIEKAIHFDSIENANKYIAFIKHYKTNVDEMIVIPAF